MSTRFAATLACLFAGVGVVTSAAHAQAYKPEAPTLVPNRQGQLDRPLRYRPEGADFVIDEGREFFNRPLYGGNTAFRVDGGDRPEFALYLPGRGGNLRLGLRTNGGTLWLHEARHVQARYRPGELHYEIADDLLGRDGRIRVAAVAYAATEGLAVEVRGEKLPAGAELVFAFGPGNGQRGRRDGDIGTERVPIGDYFQFAPAFARGAQFDVSSQGFTVITPKATISATVSAPAQVRLAAASGWNALPALLAPTGTGEEHVAVGRVPLGARPVHWRCRWWRAKRPASSRSTAKPVPPTTGKRRHRSCQRCCLDSRRPNCRGASPTPPATSPDCEATCASKRRTRTWTRRWAR
jgi:hypothetical protein